MEIDEKSYFSQEARKIYTGSSEIKRVFKM